MSILKVACAAPSFEVGDLVNVKSTTVFHGFAVITRVHEENWMVEAARQLGMQEGSFALGVVDYNDHFNWLLLKSYEVKKDSDPPNQRRWLAWHAARGGCTMLTENEIEKR